ncbi:GH-E family nuclease [Lysinibacillus xylanilyticus]|uniref:GH-E family nuclease n=1 Tax=Lysinibacillus xylanilyticus TaxID=582475 RepID=UPI003824683A
MAKKGKGFFGAVGSFLGSIPVVKKVKKAAKSVKKKIKNAKKKLKKTLKKAKKKLKKKLGKVLTKARKLKNNLSKSKLVKRFKKAVKKAVKKAKKYVKKVVKTVKKAAKATVKAVKTAAKATVKAVKTAAKTTVKAVKTAAKTTVKAVKTAAKTTVKAVKTATKTAVKAVKTATKTIVQAKKNDVNVATKKASKAAASIAQKSKYINLDKSCPAPKTYSVHDGEPQTTLTDLRKVLSTPSTVYPDGLAPFTVMGANLAYALLLEDIATYANPNATAGERNGAALSLLNPIGKAGKVKKGAEAFKDMGKGIEAAHDLANNANKVQKTQHTQKEIEQLGEYLKKQLDKGKDNDVIKGTNKKGEVTNRGSFRKGTVQDAWDNAESGLNGGKLCPTCKDEVKVEPFSGEKRDWDIDHVPAWTNREFPANVTRKEVLDNYQKGTRLECPSCNRSGGNRRDKK